MEKIPDARKDAEAAGEAKESQWVCQLTFNQKLGFSTPPYNLYGEAKKVHPLCAAVLTVQLSTDFGTSEIHCLEN